MRKRLFASLAVLVLACGAVAAQDSTIPAELLPFVEKGSIAIVSKSADLNGDGRRDHILILERQNPEIKDDFPVNQRPILIITAGADGKLTVAKRNDRLVMCSTCGGVWGDPFEDLTAARNTFTVYHYGGSNWRWTVRYKFNYSRRDKTWQLVRVENNSYHTSDPDKMERTIYTPPKHFGKIDFADFDPENYLKKGVKKK